MAKVNEIPHEPHGGRKESKTEGSKLYFCGGMSTIAHTLNSILSTKTAERARERLLQIEFIVLQIIYICGCIILAFFNTFECD